MNIGADLEIESQSWFEQKGHQVLIKRRVVEDQHDCGFAALEPVTLIRWPL